jgi:16S rRNA (adenine1518-N6/adenine1519-N6)-dimethyltransferase
MSVKAKKSFGQHFLTDSHVAQRIADTVLEIPETIMEKRPLCDLSTLRTLPIVEIGPGTGALTRHLIPANRELMAVEVDPEAAEFMRATYPSLNLTEADFLFTDISTFYPGKKIAIIGNYPYNISTQIFFKMLEHRDKVMICSGMLQREVAQRICAGPGSKVYGILSVLLQLWYDCEYLFTVDETVFRPMPKVKSGVLRLVRNSRTALPCSEELLKRIVKTTFGLRRKTLRNSLAGIIGGIPGALAAPSLAPFIAQRPEQLSLDQFIALTSAVEEILRQAK